MNKIRSFSRKIPWLLLRAGWAAILLAACSPAGGTVSSGQPAAMPSPTQGPTAEATEAALPSPLPVVTSRGPELHASDPATVRLASGGLQLVEFFRFT
jgi:hypothetical protein